MEVNDPGDRAGRPPTKMDPGRDHRPAGSVSRRRFMQVGGALAGVAAAGVGASQLGGIAGANRAAAGVPSGFTGTIADLKHVVILIQEKQDSLNTLPRCLSLCA